MMKRLLSTSIMALLYLNSQYALSEASDDLLYTVSKNDTVWAVCKVYVNDPLCWKKLVEYNQLKNPKYLPPGSIIRIPKAWLVDHSTTALVIAVEGDVLVVREGSAVELRLSVGDQLSQEDIVNSMNGSAMIQFDDYSRLLLKANSSIRMASLQFNDPSQLVKTRVELLKGRVKAQVEKLTNENSQYQISTPAAVAAVRGTEFRVARSETKSGDATVMRTELLVGALEVSSDINKQSIISGQGVVAIEGKGVGQPVKLLSRPLMSLNEAQSMALPFKLEWQAMENAVSYKITLMATNTEIWEKMTLNPEFVIDDLIPGQYEILIRGIDAQGFEGRDRRLSLTLPETR